MPQPSTNRWQLMGDKQLGDTILLGIIARAFHLKKLVQSRPIDWSSRMHAVLPVPLDTWDAWKVSRARWDEANPFRADGCWLRRVNRLSAWKIVFLSFQRKKKLLVREKLHQRKSFWSVVCVFALKEKSVDFPEGNKKRRKEDNLSEVSGFQVDLITRAVSFWRRHCREGVKGVVQCSVASQQ